MAEPFLQAATPVSYTHLVKLFEHTVEICNSPKDAANWIMGELMKMLNDTGTLSEDVYKRQPNLR